MVHDITYQIKSEQVNHFFLLRFLNIDKERVYEEIQSATFCKTNLILSFSLDRYYTYKQNKDKKLSIRT